MHSQQMFNECIARTGQREPGSADIKNNAAENWPRAAVHIVCRVNQLTSQQRTRRRKRSTSLCFFF